MKVVGLNVPDDVWAPCGVQFRMVNYIAMPGGRELMAPSGHSSLQGTLEEFWTAIQKHPRFQDNVVTVLIAPWCADVGAGDAGQLFPPAGQSLLPQHLACIRPGMAPNVLAHELGHVIMSDKSHHSEASCGATSKFDQNVMCAAAGPGVALDTSVQCRNARQHLASTNILGYFPAQK